MNNEQENYAKIYKLLSGQVGTAAMLFQKNHEALNDYLIPWRHKAMQVGRILKKGVQNSLVEILGTDNGITVYKVL